MTKAINILIVEDNPADAGLIKESFKSLTGKYNLHFVYDGVEAMTFLYKENEYLNVPEPNLILLDLNIPLKNGYEVLQEIKNNDKLKHIPVIILSTSNKEVMTAYNYHANSYIQKPVDFDQFIEIVKAIEIFWIKSALLPI